MRKPATSVMSPAEFRAIRTRLGISQSKLALVLGYKHAMSISLIERGQRPILVPVAHVLRAMSEGYNPGRWEPVSDWL